MKDSLIKKLGIGVLALATTFGGCKDNEEKNSFEGIISKEHRPESEGYSHGYVHEYEMINELGDTLNFQFIGNDPFNRGDFVRVFPNDNPYSEIEKCELLERGAISKHYFKNKEIYDDFKDFLVKEKKTTNFSSYSRDKSVYVYNLDHAVKIATGTSKFPKEEFLVDDYFDGLDFFYNDRIGGRYEISSLSDLRATKKLDNYVELMIGIMHYENYKNY